MPIVWKYKMNRHLTLSDIEKLVQTKTSSELIDALTGAEINGQVFSTHTIKIESGMLPSLGSLIQQIVSPMSKFVVLMDENTREAAGESLLTQLPDHPEPILVKPLAGWNYATPHMDVATSLLKKDLSCDALIAVGSGTINDLAKYTAHMLHVPYLVVATAPSMNGYTSSVAALIKDGLKVTIPCRPPVAVLADVEVLAKAPARMLTSGYADLLSSFLANTDWRLANLIMDQSFSPIPGSIVYSAIDRCISAAEGIKEGNIRAVKILMESLILSGYSMAAAGSSAPASGGEHLISHYLDMVAYQNERHPALHGLQVALGTLLTSKLYELVADTTIDDLKPPLQYTPDPEAHGNLWPAVRSEAEKQEMAPRRMERRVSKITHNWERIWGAIDPVRKSSDEIYKNLVRAGAPCTPGELGISPGLIRKAFLYSADIRNRYTILHLARDLGLLHDSADEVFAIFE